MYLSTIKELMASKQFDEALQMLGEALVAEPENGYLWKLRGYAIQLLDHASGPPLSEVERSYLKALEINPNDLEVIEDLAHYYDAVASNPEQAKKYAGEYLRRIQKVSIEMNEILNP